MKLNQEQIQQLTFFKKLQKAKRLEELILDQQEPYPAPEYTINQIYCLQYAVAVHTIKQEGFINSVQQKQQQKNKKQVKQARTSVIRPKKPHLTHHPLVKYPLPLAFAYVNAYYKQKMPLKAISVIKNHLERTNSLSQHIINYNLSHLYREVCQYKKAIFHLQLVLKQNPFFEYAIFDYAFLLGINNRANQAIQLIKRHINNNQTINQNTGAKLCESSLLQNMLINLAYKQKQFSQKQLLRIFNNKPMKISTFFNLGVYFMKIKNYHKSQQIYKQLIKRLDNEFLIQKQQQIAFTFHQKDQKIYFYSKINLSRSYEQLGKQTLQQYEQNQVNHQKITIYKHKEYNVLLSLVDENEGLNKFHSFYYKHYNMIKDKLEKLNSQICSESNGTFTKIHKQQASKILNNSILQSSQNNPHEESTLTHKNKQNTFNLTHLSFKTTTYPGDKLQNIQQVKNKTLIQRLKKQLQQDNILTKYQNQFQQKKLKYEKEFQNYDLNDALENIMNKVFSREKNQVNEQQSKNIKIIQQKKVSKDVRNVKVNKQIKKDTKDYHNKAIFNKNQSIPENKINIESPKGKTHSQNKKPVILNKKIQKAKDTQIISQNKQSKTKTIQVKKQIKQYKIQKPKDLQNNFQEKSQKQKQTQSKHSVNDEKQNKNQLKHQKSEYDQKKTKFKQDKQEISMKNQPQQILTNNYQSYLEKQQEIDEIKQQKSRSQIEIPLEDIPIHNQENIKINQLVEQKESENEKEKEKILIQQKPTQIKVLQKEKQQESFDKNIKQNIIQDIKKPVSIKNIIKRTQVKKPTTSMSTQRKTTIKNSKDFRIKEKLNTQISSPKSIRLQSKFQTLKKERINSFSKKKINTQQNQKAIQTKNNLQNIQKALKPNVNVSVNFKENINEKQAYQVQDLIKQQPSNKSIYTKNIFLKKQKNNIQDIFQSFNPKSTKNLMNNLKSSNQLDFNPKTSVQLLNIFGQTQTKTIPEQFSKKYHQANLLEQKGQNVQAFNIYTELYKSFKQNHLKELTLLGLASNFQLQKQYDQAEKTYLKCCKFNNATAFMKLGQLLIKRNRIDQGIENLQKANCIKRFDKQIQTKLVYGYSLKQQTIQKALCLANTILKRDPMSLEILIMTANILQKQSKIKQALQICLAIDNHKESQFIKHYIGTLYLSDGNIVQAFKFFKNALQIKSNHVPSLIEIATILSQLKPKQAISILNKAIQIEPNNRLALTRLAKIYESIEQDPQRALQIYRRTLQTKQNYEAYIKIGDCFAINESYLEALANYKQALNLKKTHQVLSKIAQMHQFNKQYKKSVQNYQQALQIIPNEYKYYKDKHKIMINMSKDMLLLQQYDSAIATLQNLLQTQQSKQIYSMLGQGYFGKQQYSISLQFYQKANNLEPQKQDMQILERLALCFDKKEQFNASKQIYQKILEIDPTNIKCMNNFANILLICGNTNEAFYWYEVMLQQCPKVIQKRIKVSDIYAAVGDWSKVQYHLLICYKQKQHDPKVLEKLINLYKQKRQLKLVAKYEKKLALLKTHNKKKQN